MSTLEEELKPFEYELPKTPKSVVDSWIIRLQAVAIVTALLAQIEVSLIGGLEPASANPSASDNALRIFGYGALILNLGATLSAVLLLLAVTSVPTAARRLYMTCGHGYPRKVFLHSMNESKQSEMGGTLGNVTTVSGIAQFPQSRARVPDTSASIEELNQLLRNGDTERSILSAFGVAKGWDFLLKHCIICFVGGCICAFAHVTILVWLNESITVASVMMPMAAIGFIPPLVVFFFLMDSPLCELCHKESDQER